MSKVADMIPFRTPDGTVWGVEVSKVSGPSNALILFHHPDGSTNGKDRYSWLNWHGPQADDVTVSLKPADVYKTLNERVVKDLFTRSMPIGKSGKGPARSFA